MIERWNRWVVDHPALVLVLALVACALAGMGLKDYQNNNDPRIFFTEENPDYKRFRELEDRFTSNEMVMFIVHPESGEVFEPDTLTALEELTDLAWTLPSSTRVDSLTNFQHTDVEGDDLYTSYLIEDAQQLTDEQIQRIRSIALDEPTLVGRLVSAKGHVAGVAVTVTMEEGHREAPLITSAAREIRDQMRQRYPDIEFMLTGTVVFSEASKQATDQAMTTTFPLAGLAMLLCLFLIVRSLLFTGIVVVVIGLSIVSATGLAILLGVEFSPIVSLAPAMILTLAVADCVHLLSTYRHERLAGHACRESVLESMRINFQPIWLTSLTTAIGFAILNFSESQPFRALGDVVVGGVMIAFLLSVTVLPALLLLVPHRIRPHSQVDYDPAMLWFADRVIRFYKPLLAGMTLVVVALVAALPTNHINDVFNEYFDETFDVRRVNDFAMREMTGMHRIDYSIHAGAPGATMEPEFLANLDRFTDWLSRQDHVVYATAFSDVIKRLNRDMHGGDEDWYRVPEQRDLISQYTLLYELSLPQGLGLDNQLDINREYARVSVVLENIGSTPVLEFNRRAEQWLEENMPEPMHAKGTGMDILFGHVTLLNIQSMLGGAAIGLAIVSLLLVIALRSWWYGVLSLVPNMLPAAMAFGVWGLINGEIGLAVSIVACMTIGIVVDDTVHFLSKYVRAKRELGLDTEGAVRYAFRTVGVALVATSVVLVTNFAVIGTSHFYPNSSMGMLSAITIAMALVVDFLFFVPLLIALDRRRRKG